jgi:hypothetical protein
VEVRRKEIIDSVQYYGSNNLHFLYQNESEKVTRMQIHPLKGSIHVNGTQRQGYLLPYMAASEEGNICLQKDLRNFAL